MFEKIVIAHDGSAHAERAFGYAVGLARREGAKLVLVHIDEETIGKGGGPMLADEEEIRGELSKLPEELADDGIDATMRATTVRLGGPAPAIVEIANDEGADLIVAGSAGMSALSGVFLGSVTHKLIHLADQPVLIVTPNSKPAGDRTVRMTSSQANA